jgi:alpha-L-rhamnosidase
MIAPMALLARRPAWLDAGARRLPLLHRATRAAMAVVRTLPDGQAFQGWCCPQLPGPALPRTLPAGGRLVFDLGEHVIGTLRVGLRAGGPVRMRCQLGELPAEVAEEFDPFHGKLPRSWLQDTEIVHPGDGSVVELPRRAALRFVRIDHLSGPDAEVQQVTVETVSSAPSLDSVRPPDGADPLIDRIALRTLRNCMQEIFEDGPKRDRRLWLGDLRLQAQADSVTFRTPRLVERCLCLLAGVVRERDGVVPACVFLTPVPHHDTEFILDYMMLFAACLRDLLDNGGDRNVVADLADLAFHQCRIALAFRGADGAFRDPGGWWLFVDWREGLDKQAAIHGCLAFACHAAVGLAERLGRDAEAAEFRGAHAELVEAARRVFAPASGACWTSGAERQVSWASHAWLTLGGCLKQREARDAFAELATRHDAVLPASPYLVHHVVEALRACGAQTQAATEIDRVWGAMARLGASTFW